MIFNRWKKYPKRKPKEEGWYQCTVLYGINGTANECPTVMDLYWWNAPDRGGVWLNKDRQGIFDGYKVFLPCRAPIDDNRVYTDSLCERVDVIAWRELSEPYISLKMMREMETE